MTQPLARGEPNGLGAACGAGYRPHQVVSLVPRHIARVDRTYRDSSDPVPTCIPRQGVFER